MKTLDINGIKEYLPHRYPLLLVDRVLDVELGKRITAIKNVTVNEEFFNGHFPHKPVMPGVLMIEGLHFGRGLNFSGHFSSVSVLIVFSSARIFSRIEARLRTMAALRSHSAFLASG